MFCALYRVGLLGYVHHDRIRGEWAQRFLRPGEATLEPDGMLPHASHYLVHPVLTDVIGRSNPAYLQRMHRGNIVGYGRVWRDVNTAVTVQSLCVLKGDVYGYGGLMHARADGPVRQALQEALERWARRAVIAHTDGGDSLLIVHEDPVELAQTARHIMDEVYRTTHQPRLRMALHYGEVELQPGNDHAPPEVLGGSAILCAARIEPHVIPGQIWTTEQFRELLATRPSLWRTTELRTSEGGEQFNVSKAGRDEPDLWVRLYRLEF